MSNLPPASPSTAQFYELIRSHKPLSSFAGQSFVPGGQRPNPMWGMYLPVDDVDACAASAHEFGGSVHEAPFDIPGVGRVCGLRDPDGSVIYLMSPPRR